MSDSKPVSPVPPDRPAWLPETGAARAASYRLAPPAILAFYEWEIGTCFMCRTVNRFVTAIGARGGEGGEEAVPLTVCGSCVLAQEEERRARMIRSGRRYVPGRIGQPE
ncbi:hypothetical protein ACFXAZ_26075 [Streptomyces sp. NPDC059477]|uniref:hypothetical protein n=1 Tax=Streptomyces sp. NPDC059477 TaxID=3346847 RepID=UPI00367C962A